ncbi:hypothetical protein FRC19_006300 [Serendipita sp. 401]|nr:hypothetical protein FRC19_006300 [Serendipita sp. 401]KAG8837176.1 hypothetical protein FRC18_009900 [Serendipita sp. 400]
MSITVPYSEFQIPDNILVDNGGSWEIHSSSDDVGCFSAARTGHCALQGCLLCIVLVSSSDTYSIKYVANVSIPMSTYGNANSLDYNFSYHFMWTSEGVAAGLPLSTRLTVGTSSNTDSFLSVDPKSFDVDNQDLGNPFSHSGATSLLKSADGNTAYIPITLDFSFTSQSQSNYSSWGFMSRTFKIVTSTQTSTSLTSNPVQSVSPSNSISPSIMGSMNPTSDPTLVLSTITIPGSSPQVISSLSANEGSEGSSSSNTGLTRRVSPAMVAGVAAGVLLLLGTVFFIILLLYKRKQGGVWGTVQGYPVWNRQLHLGRKASSLDEDHLAHPFNKGSNIVSTDNFYTSSSSSIPRSRGHQFDSQREEDPVHGSGGHDLGSMSPLVEVDVPPPAYSTIMNASRTSMRPQEHRGAAENWIRQRP